MRPFAADPKRLGGRLGMTAVLHPWGQNLSQHVHLHCLIPGGVLTKGNKWHAAKSREIVHADMDTLSKMRTGEFVADLSSCTDCVEVFVCTWMTKIIDLHGSENVGFMSRHWAAC